MVLQAYPRGSSHSDNENARTKGETYQEAGSQSIDFHSLKILLKFSYKSYNKRPNLQHKV
jgi:hypothetical protein